MSAVNVSTKVFAAVRRHSMYGSQLAKRPSRELDQQRIKLCAVGIPIEGLPSEYSVRLCRTKIPLLNKVRSQRNISQSY